MKGSKAFLAALALLSAAVVRAEGPASMGGMFAQGGDNGLPLDEKVRFERALETKAESVLAQMLGPNQAKVVIDATLDFTRTERVEIQLNDLETKIKPAGSADAGGAGGFLWEKAEDENKPQILPGYPVQEAQQAAPAGKEVTTGNQRFQRQFIFPDSLVKRLSVTLLLNRTLPLDKSETARSVITDLLGIKEQERGDSLNVVRTDFPPPWQTVWNSSESAMFIAKYGILTIMTLLSLVVLGASFFRMAGAMAAMARTQMHQIQMDIPRGGGAGALPGLPGAEGGAAASPEAAAAAAAAKEAASAGGGDSLTFDVRPEQTDFLAELIGREDPANISLVVAHLAPDSRAAFLSKLPAETTALVLDNLARVKFVDPESILTLKEELERRLKGSLGGTKQVLELLDGVDLQTRRTLIDELWRKNPALAKEVRRRTLLLEDLVRLPDDDLAIFVPSVRLDDWATALADAPQALKDGVKGRLPAKSWQIIEQTMSARKAGPALVRAAHDKILAQARKSIAEGRISDPLANLPDLIAGAAGGGAAPAAGA